MFMEIKKYIEMNERTNGPSQVQREKYEIDVIVRQIEYKHFWRIVLKSFAIAYST